MHRPWDRRAIGGPKVKQTTVDPRGSCEPTWHMLAGHYLPQAPCIFATGVHAQAAAGLLPAWRPRLHSRPQTSAPLQPSPNVMHSWLKGPSMAPRLATWALPSSAHFRGSMEASWKNQVEGPSGAAFCKRGGGGGERPISGCMQQDIHAVRPRAGICDHETHHNDQGSRVWVTGNRGQAQWQA